MRFSSILIAPLSLFALTSTTLVKVPQAHSQLIARAASGDQFVKSSEALTQESRAIDPLASSIESGGLALLRPTSFSPVIVALSNFVRSVSRQVNEANNKAPQTYTNAGQAKICQAYKKFAEQHETLMDILITKANVVGSLIAGPFRYSLQQDEKILDNFIFQVIDAVPSCAIEAKKDRSLLEKKLTKAICAYTPPGTIPGPSTLVCEAATGL